MRKLNLKALAIFLLLLCRYDLVFSQTEAFKYITVEDGLPQSQVHCIFQDRRGYLWLGTDAGGVCRYDGKTFITYNTADGLAANRILSLTEDPKGNIWMGTNQGVSIFNGREFLPTPSGLELMAEKQVSAILAEQNGNVWLGADNNLYLWNGSILQKFDSAPGFIHSIFKDSQENIWAGTEENGLYKIIGSTVIKYTTANGLSSPAINQIAEPIKGELWICNRNGIDLLRIKDNRIKTIPELKAKNILTLLHDNKNVWASTEGIGITKFGGQNFRQLLGQQKFSTDLWCAIKDRDGNRWFGTNGAGIIKYQFSPFSKLTEQDGISGNIILSILHDSKGNEWYGTENGVTEIIRNKVTGEKKFNYFMKNDRIWAIIEDKKGNIWFSTVSKGVYKYDGHSLTNYLNANAEERFIRSLIEDSKGNIWIGARSGLVKYDGRKFETFLPGDGMPDPVVLASFKDSKGNLWFVSFAGLFKYNPKGGSKKFISFTKANGLINEGLLAVTEDSDGNIWCGGFSGISRVDLKTMTCKNITTSEGLASNSVYVLVADKQGNIYVGTNQGIDKFNTSIYNRTGKVEIKHYGKEEGFTGMECNTNSFFSGKDNSIWFGTINGAIKFDPSKQQNNSVEPLTYITGINLFFEPLDWTNLSEGTDSTNALPVNLKLPYNKNHLTFNCIALALTIPEKTLYSFKMVGFDKAWSPFSKQSYATYSYLPPGNYTFMVRAMNSNGVWTDNPAKFSFTITPPFWQTWWFYLLAGTSLVVAFMAFLRIRFNSLQTRAKELQKTVTIKTAELKKEKETVELQNKLIEKKNKNITASLNYAQRIQNTVLPIRENIQKLFPNSLIFLKPKDIVSGDFYWFSELDSKIIIASADCTGHGIPGAFMSLIGNNLLNNVVNNNKITNPSTILHRLHEELVITLKKTEKDSATVDGMDIALLSIDREKLTLEFASTGQPLIIIRNGEMQTIKGGKYPLGLMLKQERVYENYQFPLQKEDVLYLFTDGFGDQFGEYNDEKYSEERLKNLLLEIHNQEPIDQEYNLNRMLNLWKGSLPQLDDIMVIGIRI